VAEENASAAPGSETLIRQLGLFVSTAHARFDRLEALFGTRPGPSPSDLFETLVDHFVMENVPISHVDAWFLRVLLCRLDPTVASHMPNAHQFREARLRRALALRQSVTVAALFSPFVSLIADGVRKAGHLRLGTCLATVETLYFWRLVDETDQKSATIEDALAETIRDVQNRGFTVCSIVTDNASNECAALDPAIETSVQRRTGVIVIRTPCLSHTANLAVADFLKSLGSALAVPCRVWKDMVAIRNALYGWSRGHPFHSLPSLCPTRWLLMGRFVAEIALRYPDVSNSLEPMGDAEGFNALNKYKFAVLFACLQASNTFTQWTEGLQANLGPPLGKILKLFDRFAEMERNHEEYIGPSRVVFFQRIPDTAHLTQLLLSFLVTADGLGSYRRLSDERAARLALFWKQLVQRGVRPLQVHFQKLLGVDETLTAFIWDHCLRSG
jgi:hypothetical protein